MADVARLEALTAEVLSRSEKEQARLGSALSRFKYNTALFSVLVVVWLLRSVETLGSTALICAFLAIGGLLTGLHMHESRSLHEARQTANEMHERVGNVTQQVSELLKRREQERIKLRDRQLQPLQPQELQQQQLEQQRQQQRQEDGDSVHGENDASSVRTLSSIGSAHSLVRGSPRRLQPQSPASFAEAPRSVRSFGGWSLRSDRSDASNVSELPHAESSRSTSRNGPKKRSFVRRVLMRRRRKSSNSSADSRAVLGTGSASAGGPNLVRGIQPEADRSSDEAIQQTNVDSEASEDIAEEGEDHGETDIPSTFCVTDNIHIPAQDILQPPVSEGIEELRSRVADVVSEALERRYGGPIRFYERYLFARNEKVSAAEKMIRETIKFRTERGMDDPESEKSRQRQESFSKLRSHWPGEFLEKTSQDGSPIQVFRYRELRPKELMKHVTEEEFSDFYISWMEMTLELQNRANSRQYQALCNEALDQEGPGVKDPDAPHEWKSFIELHDLSGLSFSQLHPPGIAMLTRVLKVGQGHYPENLRVAYIVNAPFLFSGAWKIISKVLDPSTVEKINVHSGVPREKMVKHMNAALVDELFPR